jgi:hypothetical protein
LWMLGRTRREQLRLRTAGGRHAHHPFPWPASRTARRS